MYFILQQQIRNSQSTKQLTDELETDYKVTSLVETEHKRITV